MIFLKKGYMSVLFKLGKSIETMNAFGVINLVM